MIVAIASGKGGTGKTTVAVSLALSLMPSRPTLLDCDVEEPNAALFLGPSIDQRRQVGQMIPLVDPQLCTYCGRSASTMPSLWSGKRS
jgi:MinD superfamily P-loop ATPase